MRDGGDGICIYVLLQAIIGAMCPVSGLRDVRLSLPMAAPRGSRVKLSCDYDLEDAQLYSLKWYRGDQEFFRFVPRDDPPTRIFPQQGLNVDISFSGARGVILTDVRPAISGVFKCEVSADAPLFHTVIKEATMVVVDPPDDTPKLSVVDGRLQFVSGDTLRANCSSPPSFPAANLTWFIDGRQVQDSYVRRYPAVRAAGDIVGKLLRGAGIEDGVRGHRRDGKEKSGEETSVELFEAPLEDPLEESSILGLEMRLDNSTVTFPEGTHTPHPPPAQPPALRGNADDEALGRSNATTAPISGALLRLRCLATLFTLYRRTTELELAVVPSMEDNAPKIAPVLHEEAHLGNDSSGFRSIRPTGSLCVCGLLCFLWLFHSNSLSKGCVLLSIVLLLLSNG